MATPLDTLISIGIDSTKAKSGAREVSEAFDHAGGAARRADEQFADAAASMQNAGEAGQALGAAIRGAVLALGGSALGVFVYRTLSDFEEAMIEVSNSTDIAEDQLAAFEARVLSASSRLPTATRDLVNLVVAAKQLGDGGTEDAFAFAEAMERVGAVTGMRGPSAAREFAQALRSGGREVTAEEVLKLGGAIDALSDATGASSQQLLSQGRALAQLLDQYDVTAEEAAALAGAMDRLGVRSNVALQIVQQLVGVITADFLAANNGSMADALVSLLTQLQAVEAGGGSAARELEKLGVTVSGRTARQVGALVRSSEEMARALAIARDEATNVNDVMEASDRAFNSTANQVARTRKALGDFVVVAAGEFIPDMRDAAGATADLVTQLYEGEDGFARLTPAGNAAALALAGVGAATAVLLGMPALSWAIGFARNLYGVAGAGTAVTVSLAGVAGVLTGIMALDFGGYLYDEFRTVQEAMARFLGTGQLIATFLGGAFRTTFAVIKAGYMGVIDTIVEGTVDGVENVATLLYRVGALSDDQMRELYSSAAELRAKFDYDLGSETDKIGEDLSKRLETIRDEFAATMDAIERDFNGQDRRTNQSWFERFGDSTRKLVDELLADVTKKSKEMRDQLQGAGEDPEQFGPPAYLANKGSLGDLQRQQEPFGPPRSLMNKEERDTRRRQVDDTREYAEELDRLMDALRFEADLIGKSNDERERAEAIVRARTAAEKAFGVEQARSNLATAVAIGSMQQIAAAAAEYRDAQESVNEAVDDYVGLLERVQRARAAENTRKSREALGDERSLIGASDFVAENADSVLNYYRESLREYGGDVAAATKATDAFVSQLEQMDVLKKFAEITKFVGSETAMAFEDALFEAKSFEDGLEDVLKNVSRMVFNTMVTQQIAGFLSGALGAAIGLPGAGAGLGSLYGGGRASGGPVSPGQWYDVGEQGPERLYMGRSGGFVVPNSAPQQAPRQAPVVVNVSTPDAGSFSRSARQVGRAARSAMRPRR